jgi:hypothetical protein
MSMTNMDLIIYSMPEISDFQRTSSEFAKSEQKYPVTITCIRTLIFTSGQSLSESVHYHQGDIFPRKKIRKFDPWSLAIEPWYPGVV